MRTPENNLGIVADSTTSLSPKEAARLQRENRVPIKSVASWLKIGEEYLRDDQIEPEVFYERYANQKFETSNANIEQFQKAYQELIEQENVTEIISIHSHVGLTGGINSATAAAEAIKNKYKVQIYNFDTKTVTGGALLLVYEALKMAKKNLPLTQIVETLEKEKENIRILVALTNAKYLFESAKRRASVQHLIAASAIGLLRLRPIITIEGTEILVKAKPRTRKRSMQEIGSLTEKERGKREIKRAVVFHTGCLEEAKELAKTLNEQIKIKITDREITEAGPVLAVYGGQGCYGVAVLYN